LYTDQSQIRINVILLYMQILIYTTEDLADDLITNEHCIIHTSQVHHIISKLGGEPFI
jgi:hypothetical protein